MSKHKKMSKHTKKAKERRKYKQREKAVKKLYKGILYHPIFMTGFYMVFSAMLICLCIGGLYQNPGGFPIFLPIGFLGLIVMPGFFIAVRNPYKYPFLFKLYFCGSTTFRWAAVNTDIIELRQMYNKDYIKDG